MKILVLNSGSSSLKFRIVEVREIRAEHGVPSHRLVIGGAVSCIGSTAQLDLVRAGTPFASFNRMVPGHAEAVAWLFEHLAQDKVEAVGHRIVHGGDQFRHSIRISDAIVADIEQLTELAPLHNPACVAGIRGARAALGMKVPMVAVFDTAFHQTLPEPAAAYAIPHELAVKYRIRRYGFHGIAHASLAEGYARLTGRSLDAIRLITLHLGNGCSATAIRNGRSVDTSMGLTPLEGLVMGTRSGDLDPAVLSLLARGERVRAEFVEQWLNEQSGLLGLSGLTHDMRVLLAAEQGGNARAGLAIDVFCYRARKYIGAYLAALGGADAVIFGGGIGENAPTIRARICEGMDWCGLQLNPARNEKAVSLAAGTGTCISREGAGLAAYVVAVDEEAWIARETVRCLYGK